MWRLAIVGGPMTMIFLVGEMLVLGGTGLVYPGGQPGPFAPYEAMMPGRPIDTSMLSPCLFRELRLMRDRRGYCQSYPDDDLRLAVTVSAQRGIVQGLSFSGGHFRFGDLVRRWGRPTDIESFTTESRAFTIHARWDSRVFATITPAESGGRLNYLTPVSSFTIGGE